MRRFSLSLALVIILSLVLISHLSSRESAVALPSSAGHSAIITTAGQTRSQLPAGSFLTIIPHSATGGGFLTRLLITNLSGTSNSITIRRFSQSGAVVETTTTTLDAASTLLLAGTEEDRAGELTIEWFAIGSERPLSASVVFDFDSASLDLEDDFRTSVGVLPSPPVGSFTVPVRVETVEVTVSLALANLEEADNTVDLTLRNAAGATVATDSLTLGPLAQTAFSLQDRAAFHDVILGVPEFEGSLEVTTADPEQRLGALVIANSEGQLSSLQVSVDTAGSVVPPPDAVPGVGVRTFLPHSATGGGFLSRVSLTNLTGSINVVTLKRYSQEGVLLESRILSLPPEGTSVLADSEGARPQPLSINWFALRSDFGINASVVFDFNSAALANGSDPFRTLVEVLPALPVNSFTAPVLVATQDVTVGLAIANITNSENNLELKLLDQAGTTVAEDSLTLGPLGQTAFAVHERAAFHDVVLDPEQFIGALTVTSSQAMAALVVGNNQGQLFSLPVTPGTPNELPLAVDLSSTTPEDTPLALTLSGSDPEGDPLTITLLSAPVNGSLGDVTPLSDTSAEVTYTPDPNFNGSDSFTFQVEDTAGGTAAGTVSLEVTPVNDPPVANDDALGDLLEDVGPTILDVLANDSDPEGDTLTIAGVAAAMHGTVVNNGNNLTYTPNPVTSNSAESFTYAVNDGQGGMDTATVSFTVINVNDPPTAVTDTPTVGEDSGANAIDVLANDTDPNADTLTVSAVTQPANGTVVNNGANVSYTPNLNFNGADSFTYTVDDGNGGSDVGTVNVTVTNVNDAPTPVDDALAQGAVTTEDSSVIIDVLANDTDPDIPTPGDTLTVVGVDTTGTLGLVTNNGTNVTYNPDGQFENLAPGQSMTDTFTYTIQDAAAAAGTTFATVTVTINGVNDPPIVNVSPSFDALGNTALQVVNSGGSQTISPAVFATYTADLATDATITDPDGPGPFTFALNSATTGAVVNVNSDGTFDYTPPAGTSGADSFTYTVSDGAGGMTNGTVDINIAGIVWFVQNDHSGTNQGTSTNPFQTLAAAETAAGTGDTIFVREGDGTTTGQNAGISLKGNQRLIGEGVALTTGGTFNGTVDQQLIAAGNKPLIGNTTTHGVTINDVTGVEVRGLNISTTAGSGVAVSEAAGGTVTATVTDNTLSGTTAGFEASTTTGTVNIDLSRNTGLTASAGPAVDINGSAGGTLNITGFADNTVSGTTSGIGISVNTAIFDADPADADFTGDQVSGGATAVGTSGDPVGTSGIVLTTVSGDLAFTDLDIFNSNGTGLKADSVGTLNAGAGTGFSLTIPAGSTISSTGGPALDLDPLTAGITLDTIASTSSATTGIDLTDVAGTVDINGGSITGSTGTAFNINGGTATVSYDGSITQSNNAAMVSVSGGHSTGTVTFQTGTLSATNGTGLQFDNADGTYNFNGTNTLNGGDAGIDIVNGSAGSFTFSSNSSITNPTGTGFNLNGGNGTVTYNGTISKNNAGRAVEVQNRTGGTATFAGTISSTSSSTGLNVANNSSGAPTITFSGATKTINTGANAAVTLSSNTGATINFSNGGLDIDTSTGTGFTAAGGGTVNVTGSSNSITSTSGKALDAANVTMGATFASVSSSSSPTNGIILDTIAGTLTMSGGSISAATGNAFDVNAGTAAISYAGSITNSAARAVEITNTTGGSVTLSGSITETGTGILVQNQTSGSPTITFSGSSKSLTTGANNAVQLDNNDNATITFSGGGLVISTTSGRGFNVINGASAVNVTGTGNTISSTTGRALNVESSTIGASGLTFRSISANGTDIGINLASTGSSGGLTVTGNAGSCTSATPTCTGGRIQNTTGANGATAGRGINLSNTRDISLSLMRLDNHSNYAIRGDNVTNFTLSNSLIDGANGNSAADDEDSVRFTNLLGSASITSTDISGGLENNLTVLNDTGTLNRLTISGSTFRNNDATLGNDGIRFATQNPMAGTATNTMNVTVQNSTFTANRGDHFDADAVGSSQMDIVFTGNALTGGHANAVGQSVLISNSESADVTFNVSGGNSINGAIVNAYTFFQSASSTAASSLVGTFSGNTIGTTGVSNSGSAQGSGLAVTATGLGTVTITVSGNTIRQYNNMGIDLSAGDTAPVVNATITGNTIKEPQGFALHGIHANIGTTSGSTFTACVDVGGAGGLANDVVGGGLSGNGGSDVRLRQRNSSTIRLPGYGGTTTDTAAVATYIQGRNTGSPTVSASTSSPPGGGFVGGAACAQP